VSSRKETLKEAFERQALPHLDALYAMALRLAKNERDAEDLVQDTMVKAFRFFHRFEEGTNAKAWLFKVLVNLFYNSRRKAKKDQRLLQAAETGAGIGGEPYLSEATVAGLNSEAILLDQLVVDKLRAAVEELPEEFQMAVILCDLQDFSYKEIAEILDCPVGTVMSRLYRGRRLLQKKLHDYAVEQGYLRPARGDEGAEGAGATGATSLEAFRNRRGR
jgi:RNA polymerase sigma-70 factor, ECF subfamily